MNDLERIPLSDEALAVIAARENLRASMKRGDLTVWTYVAKLQEAEVAYASRDQVAS